MLEWSLCCWTASIFCAVFGFAFDVRELKILFVMGVILTLVSLIAGWFNRPLDEEE